MGAPIGPRTGADGEIEGWRDRANCIGEDPELFYSNDTGKNKRALAICWRCEVRLSCLDYAMRAGETRGIWGGTSGRERQRIKLREGRRT